MNGYAYAKSWYGFACSNKRKVKPIHHAIIHWIYESANRSEWDEEFQLPTKEACDILGISDKNTFLKALADLVEFGAITILEESKNIYTARWVTLKDCSMYRMENPHATTTATTHGSTHATTTNIKPIKPNKPKETLNIDFVIFWDLYGKKEDRAKSEKKWNSLSDKERQLAIVDIPKYLKSLRDRQYQKNPLTYLNGKCWEDEREENKILPFASPVKRLTLNDTYG